jgi:hypothetical protein
MREIDNIEYFDVKEINKKLINALSEDQIINLFEKGILKGKKIDNKWYATQEAIDTFLEKSIKKFEKVFGDLRF